MPDLAELNAAVYDLLCYARKLREYADQCDESDPERAALLEEADAQQAEADAIDPGHECAAWADHLRGTN